MRQRKRARVLRRALVTIVMATLAVGGAAQPAHAEPADLTCIGSESVSYDPPITATPQVIRIRGTQTLVSCTSPSHPEITSGIRTYDFEAVRSCVTLTDSPGPTFTWEWNNGDTTTMQVNFVNSTVATQVISYGTGAVTAGTFDGDTVVITLVGYTADVASCLLPFSQGVRNRSGIVTMNLTSVT